MKKALKIVGVIILVAAIAQYTNDYLTVIGAVAGIIVIVQIVRQKPKDASS